MLKEEIRPIQVEEYREYLIMQGQEFKYEEDYQKYTDYLNVCNVVSGNRLTPLELMSTHELIIDVMHGRRKDLGAIHDPDLIIKLMYDLFEKLPQTKGKFESFEKLLLAFGFFGPLFIISQDLKTGKVSNNIEKYNSVEGFMRMFNNYSRVRPEVFAFYNNLIKVNYPVI
ncbi:MAG: hypothetical protein PHQ32_06715 [Firmicutes bacterium]|nr:hypothetical protein [Bacillota bacterium]